MAILIIFIAIILIIIIFPSSNKSGKYNSSLPVRKTDNPRLPQNQYMEHGRTNNTKTTYGNSYEFNNCKFYIKNYPKHRNNSKKNFGKYKSDKMLNNRNHLYLKGHADDLYDNLFSEINNTRHLSSKR